MNRHLFYLILLLSAVGVRPEPIKCGTFILNTLREGGPGKDPVIARAANLRFFRKSLAGGELYYSKSGRFRIHFTRSGTDGVPSLDTATLDSTNTMVRGLDNIPDYVQWVACVCDSAFSLLGSGLGYRLPLGTVGVQMADLRDALGEYYGYAFSSGDTIVFDNNMVFKTPVNKDVRSLYNVTAAHELFHLVQFNYTPEWNAFNEPTATWMEEKLFPDVNDYLQYLKKDISSNIFITPNAPLDNYGNEGGTYDKVVWPLFLDQRYGANIIRHMWELYDNPPPGGTVPILETALRWHDSALTLASAFAEFGRWMFFTGARSVLRPGFTDAALWPLIYADTLDLPSPYATSKSYRVNRLSLDYRLIKNRGSMELGFTVVGGDAAGALVESYSLLPPLRLVDTLFLASGVLQHIGNWSNPAAHPEYAGFTNGGDDSVRVSFLPNDTLFTYKPPDSLLRPLGGGGQARIRFLDTLACRLKDSAGRVDTSGWNAIAAIEACGFQWSDLAPNAALLRRFSAYARGQEIQSIRKFSTDTLTFPSVERYLDSGILSLDFFFRDSSESYLAYSIFAVDTVNRVSFPLPADPSRPGMLRLDYAASRLNFHKSARGGRTFFILTCRNAYIAAKAFPNPVSRGPLRIAYLQRYEGGSCRLFTLSGHLVRGLSESSALENRLVRQVSDDDGPVFQRVYVWDLRNESGRRAGPGVYLYYVLDNTGETLAHGKFAVLPEP